jgi:hypothetical protein
MSPRNNRDEIEKKEDGSNEAKLLEHDAHDIHVVRFAESWIASSNEMR